MGYAAIYIPEFPSLAWLPVPDPSARSHAVAVVEGIAPLERIVSFNRAAKDLAYRHRDQQGAGGHLGSDPVHARSLSEEETSIDLVFEAAERFSPRVQIIASPVNAYARATPLDEAGLLLQQNANRHMLGASEMKSLFRDVP